VLRHPAEHRSRPLGIIPDLLLAAVKNPGSALPGKIS
jgi:hypothetical protein